MSRRVVRLRVSLLRMDEYLMAQHACLEALPILPTLWSEQRTAACVNVIEGFIFACERSGRGLSLKLVCLAEALSSNFTNALTLQPVLLLSHAYIVDVGNDERRHLRKRQHSRVDVQDTHCKRHNQLFSSLNRCDHMRIHLLLSPPSTPIVLKITLLHPYMYPPANTLL